MKATSLVEMGTEVRVTASEQAVRTGTFKIHATPYHKGLEWKRYGRNYLISQESYSLARKDASVPL